jgi:hypothetical protein
MQGRVLAVQLVAPLVHNLRTTSVRYRVCIRRCIAAETGHLIESERPSHTSSCSSSSRILLPETPIADSAPMSPLSDGCRRLGLILGLPPDARSGRRAKMDTRFGYTCVSQMPDGGGLVSQGKAARHARAGLRA